jgi:predicted transcriptional regulator
LLVIAATLQRRPGSIVRTDTLAEDTPSEVDLDRVAEIVSSYVRHHQIAPEELPALIAQVHQALAGLRRAAPARDLPAPAVSIRRSVHQDYVVCLECGYAAQMLRHHLRVAHGLEAADYRTRWQLPPDHPLTAPGYSARRSTMARAIGLGHRTSVRRSPAVTEPAAAAEQFWARWP